jgi:acetyltransferase-like isoleucine patch superfamily enzyme
MKSLLKRILRTLFLKAQAIANETVVTTEVAPISCWEKYRDYVEIDPTAILAPGANLKIFNLPATPRVMFKVGAGSHIFSSFALLRPEATIEIGANSQLGNSTFICAEKITVGDDVLMAWDVTVMDNDSHATSWQDRSGDVAQCYRDYQLNPQNFIRNKDWRLVPMKPIRIGDRTWIGFGATILKGVEVGAESVVGAKSVVTRSVSARSKVVGSPARVIL